MSLPEDIPDNMPTTPANPKPMPEPGNTEVPVTDPAPAPHTNDPKRM